MTFSEFCSFILALSTETDRDHMSAQCLIITLAIQPLTLQVLTLWFSTLVSTQSEDQIPIYW